jgi:hypothetical protein
MKNVTPKEFLRKLAMSNPSASPGEERAVALMRIDHGEFDAPILKQASAEILQLHRELLGTASGVLEKAVKIGKILLEVRGNLPHGQWGRYIKDRLAFSDQTARNYMRLYARRDSPELKNVLNLSDAYLQLANRKKSARNEQSPLEKLKKAWLKANSAERKIFNQWAKTATTQQEEHRP